MSEESKANGASQLERFVIFSRRLLKKRRLKLAYKGTWKAIDKMLFMRAMLNDEIEQEYCVAINRAIDSLEFLAVDLSKSIKEI